MEICASNRQHFLDAANAVCRIGFKNTLGLHPYNETFKAYRRNFARVTQSKIALSVFDRVQEEESAHFLLNMLASPEELFDHIRREAASVIMKITYGYTPEAHAKDPLVDLVNLAMQYFGEVAVPGKFLVDVIPIRECQ